MPNTYSQLFVQLVFAVKGREAAIAEPLREPLQQYIAGIVRQQGQKLLAIYCMPDHLHLLIGMEPTCCLSDLVREIKRSSTVYIKNELRPGRAFYWQEGFGAFSYAKSQVDVVCRYIHNQPTHHRKRTFRDEYLDFLQKFEVEYDERYLFEWYA